MGEAARRLAKEVGYVNAGTVEFLLAEDGSFYFIEVNARLQVEHPVTEWITGLDLVEWQVRIAEGEALPFSQDALVQRGHAVEARIYAEDPFTGFLPSPGPIRFLREPSGPFVRVDSGIYAGYTVPSLYDPLLSKIIVWGQNREESLERLRIALEETWILGVETTLPFLLKLIQHPAFRRGDLSTRFLEEHPDLQRMHFDREREDAVEAVAFTLLTRPRAGTVLSSPKAQHPGDAPALWRWVARREATGQ
jgi:acetyl/propionyl-CoA carboxylase alpha subunit